MALDMSGFPDANAPLAVNSSTGRVQSKLGLGHPGYGAGNQLTQLIFWPPNLSGRGVALGAAASGSALCVFDVSPEGVQGTNGLVLRPGNVDIHSAGTIRWTNTGSNPLTTIDVVMARAAANSMLFSQDGTTTTARTEINKLVTGIADATATDIFTVTIPNAAHSASIRVKLVGAIGAGGAIGADEATGTVEYDIAIARTAGVNAVFNISAAFGTITAAVAGATTIIVAGTLSAVTGAVGATNTFTIKVTITKGGGASANHTCTAYAELINARTSGITIA